MSRTVMRTKAEFVCRLSSVVCRFLDMDGPRWNRGLKIYGGHGLPIVWGAMILVGLYASWLFGVLGDDLGDGGEGDLLIVFGGEGEGDFDGAWELMGDFVIPLIEPLFAVVGLEG